MTNTATRKGTTERGHNHKTLCPAGEYEMPGVDDREHGQTFIKCTTERGHNHKTLCPAGENEMPGVDDREHGQTFIT